VTIKQVKAFEFGNVKCKTYRFKPALCTFSSLVHSQHYISLYTKFEKYLHQDNTLMIVIFSCAIQWVHSAIIKQRIFKTTIANQVLCTKSALFLSNYKLPDVMQTKPHAFSIPKDVTIKQVKPFEFGIVKCKSLNAFFTAQPWLVPERRSWRVDIFKRMQIKKF